MHPQANKLKVYLYSGLTLSGITALLYILCFALSFDTTVYYFDASPLTTVLHAVLVLSCLWIASLLLLLPRGGLLDGTPQPGRASTVTAYILTAAFIVSTFIHGQSATPSLLTVITSLCGGVSVAYAGLAAIYPTTKLELRSSLGYGVIAWSFFSLVEAYFNTYVAMNGPLKLLLMFSMVFIMLFQLQELGYTVGRGRPRVYAVFGLLNVLISGSFAVSYFFCMLTGQQVISEFLPAAIAAAAYTAHTVARLHDLTIVLQSHEEQEIASADADDKAAPAAGSSEPTSSGTDGDAH